MNTTWNYPYDITSYYNLKEKWTKRTRLNCNDVFDLEKLVLEMTYTMKWLAKYLNTDNLIFNHDYYEIVDYRKSILEVLKKFRKSDYNLFIRSNPKVLDYIEMEKQPQVTPDDQSYRKSKSKSKKLDHLDKSNQTQESKSSSNPPEDNLIETQASDENTIEDY